MTDRVAPTPTDLESWEGRVQRYWATVDFADESAAISAMQALVSESGVDAAVGQFEIAGKPLHCSRRIGPAVVSRGSNSAQTGVSRKLT